jgi:hypothetical protein
MPIIKDKLAIGVGLVPTIKNDQEASYVITGDGRNATKKIKTTGNLSEANFILSYAFNKKFAVAAVAAYSFGMITDQFSLNYSEEGYEDINILTNYKIYGNLFAFHTFYRFNENLFSGLRIKFPAKLTLRTEQESINSSQYVDDYRKLTIPLQTNFGLSYRIDETILAGLDFDYQNWATGYKIDNISPAGFNNSYRISLGVESMPTGRRFVPYYQKMYYRGGLYFGQLNVASNDNNVYEYGLGIGLGLPILTPYNRIDLAMQYGKKGSISTNSVTENVFKINISITASSLWFIPEEN